MGEIAQAADKALRSIPDTNGHYVLVIAEAFRATAELIGAELRTDSASSELEWWSNEHWGVRIISVPSVTPIRQIRDNGFLIVREVEKNQ